MMHLWNSSLYLKPEQTGCGLENKRTLLSQSHFLNFTPARPLLHTLTRCASHTTTCWLHRALPLWDRWGAGFCRAAWLDIRNALLLHLLLLFLRLLSFLMAHTKLTRRSVTAPSSKPWEDCHQLPQRWRIMSANALHLCALYLCMPEYYFYISLMKWEAVSCPQSLMFHAGSKLFVLQTKKDRNAQSLFIFYGFTTDDFIHKQPAERH